MYMQVLQNYKQTDKQSILSQIQNPLCNLLLIMFKSDLYTCKSKLVK